MLRWEYMVSEEGMVGRRLVCFPGQVVDSENLLNVRLVSRDVGQDLRGTVISLLPISIRSIPVIVMNSSPTNDDGI